LGEKSPITKREYDFLSFLYYSSWFKKGGRGDREVVEENDHYNSR